MGFVGATALFSLGLFAGMLACLEAGRRIGAARLAKDPENARLGTSAIDGAVYALLGLLIAFTFSGAATRFEERKKLVGREANAIGTAYLRLDVFAQPAQGLLREKFRQYLDARISTYARLPDMEAALREHHRALLLQKEIWDATVAALAEPGAPNGILILPQLNEMIDIVTTRMVATQLHPPPIIYALLALLVFVASLLAGFGLAGSKRRALLHMVVFPAVMASAIYLILDLEYPRFGLIRVDAADRPLVELRESMK